MKAKTARRKLDYRAKRDPVLFALEKAYEIIGNTIKSPNFKPWDGGETANNLMLDLKRGIASRIREKGA